MIERMEYDFYCFFLSPNSIAKCVFLPAQLVPAFDVDASIHFASDICMDTGNPVPMMMIDIEQKMAAQLSSVSLIPLRRVCVCWYLYVCSQVCACVCVRMYTIHTGIWSLWWKPKEIDILVIASEQLGTNRCSGVQRVCVAL